MQWLVVLESENKELDLFVTRLSTLHAPVTSWQPTEGNLQPPRPVSEYQSILLPFLTISSLAKLATLIWDTPLTSFIGDILIAGKRGVFFQHSVPFLKNKNLPQGITMLINLYLSRLESFGMTPMIEEEWWEELPKYSHSEEKSRVVITQEDIREFKAKGQSTINLSAGAIITPLAREIAKDAGIEIIERGM